MSLYYYTCHNLNFILLSLRVNEKWTNTFVWLAPIQLPVNIISLYTDNDVLTFNVPLNRTVDNKGSRMVVIKTSGHIKIHSYCGLSNYVHGTKLPWIIILQWKTIPNDKIPYGIILHLQGNSWTNENGKKVGENVG